MSQSERVYLHPRESLEISPNGLLRVVRGGSPRNDRYSIRESHRVRRQEWPLDTIPPTAKSLWTRRIRLRETEEKPLREYTFTLIDSLVLLVVVLGAGSAAYLGFVDLSFPGSLLLSLSSLFAVLTLVVPMIGLRRRKGGSAD